MTMVKGALMNKQIQSVDLLDSLKNPDFCDIKIQANNGEIPASKLILSIRSEYFRAMFKNNCVESSSGLVKLPYPKTVVEKLITYLYTGEMVFEDLQLGLLLDLLDLLRLMNLSEDFKHVESYVLDNITRGHFSDSDCLTNLDRSSMLRMDAVGETLLGYLRKYLPRLYQLKDVGVLSEAMIIKLLEEEEEMKEWLTIHRFKIFVEWLYANPMAADGKAKALDFDHFTINNLASTVRESGLYSSDKIIMRMEELSREKDDQLENMKSDLDNMESFLENTKEQLEELKQEKKEALSVKDLEITKLKREVLLNSKKTTYCGPPSKHNPSRVQLSKIFRK